jgi:hypothetical protein
MFSNEAKKTLSESGDIHHSSAEHGHADHEEPAGNQVEEPEDVADNGGQSVLSEPAIEGVEDTVVQLGLLLVAILLQLDKVIAGNGGHVEALGPQVDGSRGRQHLKDPESTGGRRPGVAQNRLILTVEHGSVGSAGGDSELGCSLVEGLLDAIAVACSS